MELAQILKQFERSNGKFPQAAVEEAVARKEEITPKLLSILGDIADRGDLPDIGGEYLGHYYAMLLLAQFRETRAYPLVLRIASLPAETLETLLDDFMTEGLERVLASVCGGDLSGIKSLIENRDVNEWVRGAAQSSLVVLVASGRYSRDETVRYFAELFRGKLEREPGRVWDSLVDHCLNLYPGELIGDIRQAFEEDLVDQSSVGYEDVEIALSDGMETALAKLSEHRQWRLVDDVADEIAHWTCFQDDRPARTQTQAAPPLPARAKWSAPPPGKVMAVSQVKNSTPKIGRNDPCPCGSGKKYKKCHGA